MNGGAEPKVGSATSEPRCRTVTLSHDGVFSAPAWPRASPHVFCVADRVSPRLWRRPHSQGLRQALLPQLLRGSRRGTSASFEVCCDLLPCILSSMGSRRELQIAAARILVSSRVYPETPSRRRHPDDGAAS